MTFFIARTDSAFLVVPFLNQPPPVVQTFLTDRCSWRFIRMLTFVRSCGKTVNSDWRVNASQFTRHVHWARPSTVWDTPEASWNWVRNPNDEQHASSSLPNGPGQISWYVHFLGYCDMFNRCARTWPFPRDIGQATDTVIGYDSNDDVTNWPSLTVTCLPRNALAELTSFVIHKLKASDDFAKILAPDWNLMCRWNDPWVWFLWISITEWYHLFCGQSP
jgi:hypothetical protein